jgi:hypothetical protein
MVENMKNMRMTIWLTSWVSLLTPMFIMSGVQPALFVLWFGTAIALLMVAYILLLFGIAFDWL